jgi:hypothetical protein
MFLFVLTHVDSDLWFEDQAFSKVKLAKLLGLRYHKGVEQARIVLRLKLLADRKNAIRASLPICM